MKALIYTFLVLMAIGCSSEEPTCQCDAIYIHEMTHYVKPNAELNCETGIPVDDVGDPYNWFYGCE